MDEFENKKNWLDKVIEWFKVTVPRVGLWFYCNWPNILSTILTIIVVFAICLGFFALFNKCDRTFNEHNVNIENNRTINDSTFIKKNEDGIYFYKREIDGHEYLMYTDYRNVPKTYIHSEGCPCNNDHIVLNES